MSRSLIALLPGPAKIPRFMAWIDETGDDVALYWERCPNFIWMTFILMAVKCPSSEYRSVFDRPPPAEVPLEMTRYLLNPTDANRAAAMAQQQASKTVVSGPSVDEQIASELRRLINIHEWIERLP
ncbi:MAG: hypothetical protein R3B40_07895 [Polyangiales bacterium]